MFPAAFCSMRPPKKRDLDGRRSRGVLPARNFMKRTRQSNSNARAARPQLGHGRTYCPPETLSILLEALETT
jgi:hypothetical protein